MLDVPTGQVGRVLLLRATETNCIGQGDITYDRKRRLIGEISHTGTRPRVQRRHLGWGPGGRIPGARQQPLRDGPK